MGVAALYALLESARPVMPPDLCAAVTDPLEEASGLFPVERAAVLRAVPKRRSEFAAGRRAARAALQEFGLPGLPIPMAEDRAPVWPRGITGSISHVEDSCIAVVAPRATTQSVGVDVERVAPVTPDVQAEICSDKERACFDEADDIALRRIFSAKEAAYKAQYPLTRTIFGFDTLRVAQAMPQAVILEFTRPVPPFRPGQIIPVQQWIGEGYVLSLVALPRKTPS